MEDNVIIERITAYLPTVIAALPVALAIMVGAFIINFIVGRALKLLARRTSLTDADVLPFRNVVRWAVRIMAAILVLGVFGFELGGIWAMISTILAMVAIGFVAVWSLLSNLSSTFLVLFFRPFQIGDDLEFAGEPVKGRVIDLSYFYTTLLAEDGRWVQIPNNLFFQKTLKRRPGSAGITLVHQLHSPIAAALPPPPPDLSPDQPVAMPSKPNPLMSLPDPASMSPKMPGR